VWDGAGADLRCLRRCYMRPNCCRRPLAASPESSRASDLEAEPALRDSPTPSSQTTSPSFDSPMRRLSSMFSIVILSAVARAPALPGLVAGPSEPVRPEPPSATPVASTAETQSAAPRGGHERGVRRNGRTRADPRPRPCPRDACAHDDEPNDRRRVWRLPLLCLLSCDSGAGLGDFHDLRHVA
jgi:hypothetical protein